MYTCVTHILYIYIYIYIYTHSIYIEQGHSIDVPQCPRI